LVRVGKKAALSYIIELYPDDTEFVLTIGHHSDLVRQFLSLAYPNRTFVLVEVDNYAGPGSSLGYSLLQAKSRLECPFVFHACDTVLEGVHIPEPIGNWLAGHVSARASSYRTFNVDGPFVTRVNDKGESSYDYTYIGVAGIKDYDAFWQHLECLYQEDPQNSSLSDCHAIERMIRDGCSFSHTVVSPWFDVGNVDSLREARASISDKFDLLDKDDESIYLFDDFVVKFFHNETVCSNRVTRSHNLAGIVPHVSEHSRNFYRYKYVAGDVLSTVIHPRMFGELLRWAQDTLWSQKSEVPQEQFAALCKNFYFDKTRKRTAKYLEENSITDGEHIINGERTPSVENLLSAIDESYLCSSKSAQFHGDFILDNMIRTLDNQFQLIDWRQDFGGRVDCGDVYYDLGKLNHSLVLNHELISGGHFEITGKNGEVQCNILRSNLLCDCQLELEDFARCNQYDMDKIRLISAIIWLNMSPLHHSPLNRFLFYFGKYKLFQSVRKLWPESLSGP
jgi:hypothetical protein